MASEIIGGKILQLEETTSTNEYTSDLIKDESLSEGTVIWAHYQTHGKGHGANTWQSSNGKNLTFSIVLKPEFLDPADQFYISKVAALSVKDFLQLYLNNVTIKWPNDIYSNRAKIAGILIENSFIGQKFHYSITGIGININQTLFPEDLPNPISLSKLTGQMYQLDECLNLFCGIMDRHYKTLMEKNYTLIDYNYINQLYQLEEVKEYKTPAGIIKAKITEVMKTGEIVLKTLEGQESSYGFKEIEYL